MTFTRFRGYRAVAIFFASLFTVLVPAAASGKTTDIAIAAVIPDLIEKASFYDGKRIAVEGEVIGEKLARPDGVWITILENGTALGVFVSADDASRVTMFGSYGHSGDRVSVKGVFHRACLDHGGDLDLHADTIVKLAEGKAATHAVVPVRAFWAIALCLSGATLFVLWRFRERRRKID